MKQWLYSLFFSDFIRKAIALVLAIVLYFVLHGVSDEQYYEIKNIDDVPVILNLHDDLLDTSNKHYTISVEVKGSKEALKNLSAKDLELVVDVSDQNLQKNSTYYVALSASKLYKNLDVSGVNVTKIKDKGLLLYLQKKVTVSKKIEVKYEGSLRDNLAISDVAIDPPEIEVTGPKNIVDNIASVKTEAVPLSTDITDFFEYKAKLNPIKNVEMNLKEVIINVRLVNKLVEKRFNNCKLSVLNYANKSLVAEDVKQSVSVVVEGPPDELNKLDSKDIVTYLDISTCEEVGTYNIEVMANIKDINDYPNVKVKSKVPSKVEVKITKSEISKK